MIDGQPMASSVELVTWAEQIIASRDCDLNVGPDYMHRWWIVPRNPFQNVYLHRFLQSDFDGALHDHPWDNTSIVLSGRFIEYTNSGTIFKRVAGDVIHRKSTDAHRIELIDGDPPAISLFFTGPKVRDWGFLCPNGWRRWDEFIGDNEYGSLVRICD